MGILTPKTRKMEALQKLLKIPRWATPLFNGSHYSIKLRIPVKASNYNGIKALKAAYPELIIHTAKTGFYIFGGTFPTSSQFLFDAKRLLNIKIYEVRRNY